MTPYSRRILDDLKHGENIAVYSAVAVAVVVALFNLLGGAFSTGIILLVLAFLAFALLDLYQQVKAMPERLHQVSQYAGITLESREGFGIPLPDLLKDAKQVDIFGLSLLGVLTTHWKTFEAGAKQGCKFRFLMVDPDSEALRTAVGFVEPLEHRKRNIECAVACLAPLMKTGNVEIKYTSVAPAFSLLAVDPEQLQGKIQVELYGYGITPDTRPHFVLTPSNKQWYDFYAKQFSQLWENSGSRATASAVPAATPVPASAPQMAVPQTN